MLRLALRADIELFHNLVAVSHNNSVVFSGRTIDDVLGIRNWTGLDHDSLLLRTRRLSFLTLLTIEHFKSFHSMRIELSISVTK